MYKSTSLDAVTEPDEFNAWLERDDGEVCATFDATPSESGDIGSAPRGPYGESAPVPEEMSDVTNPHELNAWLEGCGVYVAGTPLPIRELIAPTTTVPTSEPMIPCSKFEKGSILINPLMSSHPLPCAKCSELCGYSSEGKCVCYLGSPNSPMDCFESNASGDRDATPSGVNASTATEHSNQSVCALGDGNAQSLGEILPHVAKELSEVAKQLETIAMTSSSTPFSAGSSAQPSEGTPLGYTPQCETRSEPNERPTLVWNTGTSIGAQPERALDEPPDLRPGSKPRVTSPVRHLNLDSALPSPPSLTPAIPEPNGLRDTAKAGADQISQFIKSAQSRGMTGGVIRAAGDTIMQWEHGLNAAKLLKKRRK